MRDINNAEDDDDQILNYVIFTPYSDARFDQKYNEKVEKELQNGDPHESMKKYFNGEWSKYFNDNISDVIKQYKNLTWPSEDEKNMMKENYEKRKDINETNIKNNERDGDEKRKDINETNIINNEKDGNEKKNDINETNIINNEKDNNEKKNDIIETKNITNNEKDGNEKKNDIIESNITNNKKDSDGKKKYY